MIVEYTEILEKKDGPTIRGGIGTKEVTSILSIRPAKLFGTDTKFTTAVVGDAGSRLP
jgi:hypothetical protein